MTEHTTEHHERRTALRSLSEDGRPRVKVGSDPASMVTRRRKLRFLYYDGNALRALRLSEVRALTV